MGRLGTAAPARELIATAAIPAYGFDLWVREEPATRPRPGFSIEAVQARARVNVTCVTPLGEDVDSIL